MPIESKDVVWVEEPTIGFWEASFLPAIVAGLKTTISHVTNYKSVTQQYPEEQPELPLHYRGLHRLNKDDQGRVKCVACFMCSTACPAHCIDIVAQDTPAEWSDRDKMPNTFVIDELRCIYCGMCEEACPCDAIELTHIYDHTGLTRDDMRFDKEKLLDVFEKTKNDPKDPVRTHRGRLGVASDFIELPTLAPATSVANNDRAAQAVTAGVIKR